jgi:acetylornithine/succinyldiaminopimelate/putrescine aminotransferase
MSDTPVSPLPALLPTYPPYPFPVVGGAGDRIYDDQGREYLDLYGGHCVCLTGHSHPRVVDAIVAQARELVFYSTAARLPVRDAAAGALVDFAPAGLVSAFFCNSGAEANENALKLALKRTGRRRFVAFRGGWHGRTTLALSVTDDPALKAGLEHVLAPCEFLPFGEMTALARTDWSDVAAVIVEPVQSIAGVRTASRDWFEVLRDVTAEHGVVLIFDEIQTGFGRLGAPFAAELYGVTPDVLTCAKGIASGVPMAALLLSAALARGVKAGELGSTFGGGPLAAAAMLATLDVIRDEGLAARAAQAGETIRRGLAGTVVRQVRGAGLLLGLACGAHAPALKAFLESRRILVGGSADPAVLRLMPPLTLADASIALFLDAVHDFSAAQAAA